jgi:hypothetical protein
MISTKIGKTSRGAFFEEHTKSNIIFLDTFDGVERIELHKGENIKLRVMKAL